MHDYPKIYNVGHRAVRDIFQHTIHIEEKIDGSQFTWGTDIAGALFMKTHHQDVTKQEPFGLFKQAMEWCRANVDLFHKGWTYRGEVMAKPCHNLLEYERVPRNGIVLFDVDKGQEDFLPYIDKVAEGNRIGLETTPYMFYGRLDNPETIRTFMDRRPLLGGKFIEGVVVKAYGVFDDAKKTVMAKFVSDRFKEEKVINGQEGAAPHIDTVAGIGDRYKTEARWLKSIQRMKESNELQMAPQDIGKLRTLIMADVEAERGAEIKDLLYDAFRKDVLTRSVAGFPDWYKTWTTQQAIGEAPKDVKEGT